MEITNKDKVYFNGNKVSKIYLNGELVYELPDIDTLILYDDKKPMSGIGANVVMADRKNLHKAYEYDGSYSSFAEWIGNQMAETQYKYHIILTGQDLFQVTTEIESFFDSGSEAWSEEKEEEFRNKPSVIVASYCSQKEYVNSFISQYIPPNRQAWVYLKFNYAGWAHELNVLATYKDYLSIGENYYQLIVVGTLEERARFTQDLNDSSLFIDNALYDQMQRDPNYAVDESLLEDDREQELKEDLLYNLVEPKESELGRCFYVCLDTKIANAMEEIVRQRREEGYYEAYTYKGGNLLSAMVIGAAPNDISQYAALIYYNFATAISSYSTYFANMWERIGQWLPLDGDSQSLNEMFVEAYSSSHFYP